MRPTDYHTGPATPSTDATGCWIVDNLADLPVSEAELDVIEAFLGAQLRAILDGGENACDGTDATVPDSLPPESHACLRRKGRVGKRASKESRRQ